MKPDTLVSRDDSVRPHRFDGIQEYDKRLPNWWLLTLYATIVFAIGYWSLHQHFAGQSDAARLRGELAKIEAAKFSAVTTLDDSTLWQMSRNPVIVAAGKATFNATCIACHLQSLRGKEENPLAIGPNLTREIWIHGGHPTEIYDTVTKGVLIKGMPTWGPVLGARRISEVVAYVLSYHHEGEPIGVAPSTSPAVAVPGTPAPETPAAPAAVP